MMWKMSNKKRKMAFLTALIGSLMAGSSVGAANLMATIPSDYANSQMGGVTGSRVTTKVDAAPVVGRSECACCYWVWKYHLCDGL